MIDGAFGFSCEASKVNIWKTFAWTLISLFALVGWPQLIDRAQTRPISKVIENEKLIDVVLNLFSIETSNDQQHICQYARYRNGEHEFECLVCKDPGNAEAVWMTWSQVNAYCKDARHLHKLDRAKALRRSACEKLRRAQILSQKMDHTGAPASLRAELAQFLFNPTLAGPTDNTLLGKMEAQLIKFVRNEPTTLLEFAVWKAACLISDGAPKDLFELRNWWHHGWKTGRAECRRHPLIEVVLSHVMPFLPKERECYSPC